MSRSSGEPATVRPPEQPISPDGETTRDEGEPRTLGLTSATGLVIGSIVGTGVFTLPAVLAAAGTVSLVVLGVIAVGSMLLAVLFGQLTRRVPKSDGGLYAYARPELGVLRERPLRVRRSGRHGELGHRPGGVVGPGGREPGGDPTDGLVPKPHGRVEVPPAALRRCGGMVLRRQRQLRRLQRLRGQPLRRHRDRCGSGPVLLHRRRGG